jgi:superfamily II DNA or RNA helicase
MELNIQYKHTGDVRKIKAKMTGVKLHDYQIKAVKTITDGNQAGRRGLSLQTGKGKTFTAISAAVELGNATIVIVSGLVEQWVEEIQKVTKTDSIWVVKGFDSLYKLMKSDMKPEFIVCSLETLRSYIAHKGKYSDLPTYAEFINYYGIGTRINDESHKHFHSLVMQDLYADIKMNIYLTATFDTADDNLRKIFNKIFDKSLHYGSDDYDKYTNSTFYGYAGSIPQSKVTTNQGYSHIKYEQYMLKHESAKTLIWDKVYLPIIQSEFINDKASKGKKLLIFCALVEYIDDLVLFLKSQHGKKYKISRYTSDEPKSVLTDYDIIVSTHKSCGTGNDIKNLFMVFNTVSFKAGPLTRQVLGRLRKLKKVEPKYIDLVDLNCPSHVRHWGVRASIIKECSKTYKEYRIPM